MTLDQYLSSKKLTASKFAGLINRAVSTVTRIRNGQMPDTDTLQRIVAATGGDVTPNDFFVIPTKPKRKRVTQ